MSERKKMTLPGLFKKVASNEPITMLTCYDYPTAYFQEQAGIDMILVDAWMTMLYESTARNHEAVRHSQVENGSPMPG
jgi:3-methyl-2-oxobutanoate hydroxymethyltransferase